MKRAFSTDKVPSKPSGASMGFACAAEPSIAFPSPALTAIRILEDAGFETWCVGGYVRDALRGCPPDDIDLATRAQWQDAERTLEAAGYAVEETGIKHGTVTVTIDGVRIEITTFRKDGPYSDGRHPDSVTFVRTIEEDLSRRDFTMNAIAYHPARGICDPYHGGDDLRDGVIRAVGDALQRFDEDALRILRGCRFASQLGFRIEPATKFAMWKDKTKMADLAPERLTVEMTKLLTGAHAHDALMETGDILAGFLPEIVALEHCPQDTPYHIYGVWEHTAYAVQNAPATPLARWAAFLHDFGKPAASFREDGVQHFYHHAQLSVVIARGILARLTLPHAMNERILQLVRMHDDKIAPTDRGVKRTLAALNGDVEAMRALIAVRRADALSQEPRFGAKRIADADALQTALARVLDEKQAFRVRDLAISGTDLLAAGFEQGPAIGCALRQALTGVIDGAVDNERAALLAYVQHRANADEGHARSDSVSS